MSAPTQSPGALDGVRVVELAHEHGAFGGKLLADMGADVILVEPPGGDRTRSYPPFLDDVPGTERSLYWWHHNTSKRGITLNVDDEGGRDLFRRLAATADVVLECERPGRMAELGLDHPDLTRNKKELIVVSLTPFGRRGPERDEPITDLTLLASGGPVWSCGYDDHSLPPVRGGGNQGYATACHFAVLSVLTALVARQVTGRGQHVDVSMHAAANVTTEMASYHWLVQQGTVQRQTGRHALEQPSLPTQIECADGRHVTTGVPPRRGEEFGRLIEWLDSLALADELPETVFLRMGAERETLDLSKIGTDDEVTAIYAAGREALNLIASRLPAYDFFVGAQSRGMPVGVIYAPEEAFEDEHFRARGFQVEVDHPDLQRSFRYPGAPYAFEKSPWRIARRAPLLSEHTAEVLAELGVTQHNLAALRAGGVI
ncbi:MAG: CoA transferase [Candidatus Binatia bacterium]|nr:CoA transferase [Candidatus Binatia bacterium]